MKVARLPVLRTGRLYPPGDTSGIHFYYWFSRQQGQSAFGRIKSMKISNDPITNRTRDLLACSVVLKNMRRRIPRIQLNGKCLITVGI
jgi:hypothetical protein